MWNFDSGILDNVLQEIKDAEVDLKKFEADLQPGSGKQGGVVIKVMEKLSKMIHDQYVDSKNEVPVSPIGEVIKLDRIHAKTLHDDRLLFEERETISTKSWEETGVLDELVERGLSNPSVSVDGNGTIVKMGLTEDIMSETVNDYPSDVNDEWIKRSGGQHELMALSEEATSEILEMLTVDFASFQDIMNRK